MLRDTRSARRRTLRYHEANSSIVKKKSEERSERRRTSRPLIKWSHRNYFAFVLVIVGILEFDVVPQQQMGFFCNDPKISLKFKGDTISMALLLSFSIVLPLVVIWIVEYVYYPANSYENASSYGTRSRQIWHWYGHYFSGLATLLLVLEMMKTLVGEPRPHFLDTCKPLEAANCTNEYITSYTCTNTEFSNWKINDASKSFPSGHSAFSVYMCIYLVWYLQNRLPNRTLFMKPWLQCLMGVWAVICSISRMGDNRHHWWDILAGDVLGFLFGLFVVVVPCRHFYLENIAVNAAVVATTRALNESLENGQIGGYDVRRKQSIKKLLNPTVVDISEGREMKDMATWRE